MAPRIVRTAAISATEVPAIHRLVGEAEERDGFGAINEAGLLALAAGTPAEHALAVEDDRLIGYGQLLDGTGSLVVHPDHRRQGIGTAILEALLETLRQPQGTTTVAFWATRDTAAAQALAARHGLTRSRELLIMKRSLADLPEPPPVPAGVEIRPFRVGTDEEPWLTVNGRAFAHHPEQGGITRADLDQRIGQDWFDPAGFLVAYAGPTMIGFHWTKQHPGTLGEVYVIGVDPDRAGGGVGAALLSRGLSHLASRGDTEVILYTEGDNTGAIALYQRYGFAIVSSDVMYSTTAIHGR
ncbi:mycothiol synthase [Microlunatus parietis]|uniref:Mycothiol acetyltransferase n=1 Tax=Microlunatus parietis TaxID=682979 RepID=A0A7Y9IAQ5_9ACTN|nr:mycothiol synthase [Microlunatus parietis]NYE73237.1 mycothiol synthase [Microlunatus parietis]